MTLTCGHKAVHNNNHISFLNWAFKYVCHERISCRKKHGAVPLVTQVKICNNCWSLKNLINDMLIYPKIDYKSSDYLY